MRQKSGGNLGRNGDAACDILRFLPRYPRPGVDRAPSHTCARERKRRNWSRVEPDASQSQAKINVLFSLFCLARGKDLLRSAASQQV